MLRTTTLAALAIGFVLYPIAYHVPLSPMSAFTFGRLIGGGVTLGAVVFVLLWIVIGITRRGEA